MKWFMFIVLLVMLAVPASASTLVHFNNWDGNSYTREGVGLGWSGDSLWPEGGAYRVATTPRGNNNYLGQYTGSGSRLTLEISQLPVHSEVTVSFDLYVIGPWDGNYGGPDAWYLSWYDGQTGASIFWSNFSNRPECTQSYPSYGDSGNNLAQTGAVEVNNLGFSTSATYHIERTINSSLDFMRFNMYVQLGHDFCEEGSGRVLESWGMDNLRIETNPTVPLVPEPSSLLALGAGISIIATLKWRK